MKKIRIKILRYDPSDICSYGFYIINILKKHYEVELSEEPEYLFFNEAHHEHIQYSCVKIFYTGENIHPDFNLCDYAIAFDYMDFGDRYFRLPIYLVSTFYREKELKMIEELKSTQEKGFTKSDLEKKEGFCSFVYSNYLADTQRKEFFDKLSAYKKVNSGGAYLNNTGGRVDNKLGFEMKHKFSIAFENSSNDGYTTEKLPNAIVANTVPIYWGNPLVNREFNPKRFINCQDYKDFDAAVERVREVDANDEMYLDIINQPTYAEGYSPEKVQTDFEKFLRNIFDQTKEGAKRVRINPARHNDLIRNLRLLQKIINTKNKVTHLLAQIYKPFKKIEFIESIKKEVLAKRALK
jgi:hypothetical protein